jgi:hypothetical protein
MRLTYVAVVALAAFAAVGGSFAFIDSSYW